MSPTRRCGDCNYWHPVRETIGECRALSDEVPLPAWVNEARRWTQEADGFDCRVWEPNDGAV